MHTATPKLGVLAAGLVACIPAVGSAAGFPTVDSTGLMTSLGEYVLVGGGVNDFTKNTVKDRYDVGGTWNARLGIGSRSFVGGELAYVGSTRSAKGSNNDLMTNGAEAVLRLQYPYVTGVWLIEPFAFGGIGWSHYSISNMPAGAKDSDEVGNVPFGAGVTLGYHRFLLDARFTYNATFSEDLALATTGRTGDLQNWAVLGSVGYEF